MNSGSYFANKEYWGTYITTRSGNGNFCRLFVIKDNSSCTHRWGHRKSCGYSVRCLSDSQSNSIFLSNNASYSVYPNPCTDFFYIDSNVEIPARMDLVSLDGTVLKTISLNDNTSRISTADIEKGMYLIRVYYKSDELINKLIIK